MRIPLLVTLSTFVATSSILSASDSTAFFSSEKAIYPSKNATEKNLLESHSEPLFAYASSAKVKSNYRNYKKQITDEEFNNLSYIILTLGSKSPLKILSEKSKLKAAGDKIDHLHPLVFLLTVFTDDKMVAAMSNLKGKSLVWPEFKKGLFNSLTAEKKNGNLTNAYIEDFAKKLGIDSRLIKPAIAQERWDEFISILIKEVPRSGDTKRYDM